MGRMIEFPPTMAGDEQQQLQTLYSYLYQTAEALNINLAEIGNNAFTDAEMKIVRQISGEPSDQWQDGMAETETLKSLIIKTAEFVSNTVNEFRLNLLGEYVTEGKFGKYVRNTGLDVDVTPTGIQQNYSFQEIIQGLKTYEINAKNYIKTGLLRTVNGLPVYGVAIGKDVVTFSEDGTETYNDGNKVAELTADELSFWQNSTKVASYTGTAITMYCNGSKRVTFDGNGVSLFKGNTTLATYTGTAIDLYSNGSKRMTADGDGVKLYNGNTMLANYGSSKLSFYNGGNETFYIESGKLYSAGDMEIGSGKKIKIGNWTFNESGIEAFKELERPLQNLHFSLSFDVDCAEIGFTDQYGEGGNFKFKTGSNPTTPHPGLRPLFISETISTDYIRANTVKADNYENASSREIKHDIQDIKSDGDRIDRLRPVTFVYNGDPFERTHYGMIHEETAEIMPEICTGIGKENPEDRGISYIELVPVLLKEIQELRKRVKALEER